MEHERELQLHSDGRARVNFRPLLFCALGLAFGVFLYGKCRFGGLAPSDFLFIALFCIFAFRPLSFKRVLAVFLSVLVFAGVGVFALHVYTQNFSAAKEGGEYQLTGTVLSVTYRQNYTTIVLGDISLDGETCGGKCRIYLNSDEVRPADILIMQAKVTPVDTEEFEDYTQYLFSENIRYTASASKVTVAGRSGNPFLRLNSALYETLNAHLGRDEAAVAYALLTGSNSMDEGLSEAVRKGGIAHIFAVSGLHIGILYGAALLCFRRLRKYAFLPALFLAFCYCALCNFTTSSVRAVIMIGAMGGVRAFGRKADFLHALSFAALIVLLFMPAQWYSAGFRLSFGACLGLALFSNDLSRFFARLRFPRFLSGYLSANLAVQVFTLPVCLEAFGYYSLMGTVFNFFLLPVLPVLFLGVLVCATLALIVPPAAGFFLLFPAGMLSLFLYVVSVTEVTFVLSGFALGAGSIVWLIGWTALSGRFRLSRRVRAVAAIAFALLFAVVLVFENIPFGGCRIEVYRRGDGAAALVRTRTESVLLLDGDISLSECEDFLSRTYGGKLDCAVVLSENEVAAINMAAFLGAKCVRALDEAETGLRDTEVLFGSDFSFGGLTFRYESRGKVMLFAEGVAVEFDFDGNSALGADLFIGGGRGGLKYFLKDGIIKAQ